MAITINALTTGTGGLETTADASGSFSFQSNGTTIATVTSSGFSVTGTFNAGSLQVGGSDVVVDTDIGSTVQAYDADLTTLAGLSSADGNFIVGSATGWVVESGATARTSLGLGTAATTASTDYATAAQGTTADSALQPGDIGSTVQAYDADLTTLGGLSSADGNFIVGSATGWVVESGATARTSLGLGTAATTASTDYATAAQGTTADSALQPADIGSTVQAYDADTAKLDTGQTWTANQTYGDNVYQRFGNSGDLQIYHTGSVSYINDSGIGSLVIATNGSNIQLAKGTTELMLVATPDAAVDLYYDNSKKLATTSTGVSVTGTCTATAFSGDGSALTGISATPASVSDQNNTSTGYFDLPVGTTAQRPGSPANGMIRYNTSITKCEAYQNGSWVAFHDDPTTFTGQYLVVAGGGSGGGPWEGGAGGAGGYIENTSATFTQGAVYTVTVGAGGVGVTNNIGTSGSNSVLSGTGISETAIGGGYGQSDSGVKPPASGGSGGSASRSVAGGAGTAGQGNAGGTNTGFATGGGGGAGAVGANGTADTVGGNGGIGKASSITGSSTYYAGGGGGASQTTQGTGGNGGGANGIVTGTAPSGTANTGGGGGASRNQTGKGGNGGSGVVIIRVPTAKYTGTTTGSPTVTTTGSDTVIKFTGSGSYTA